MGYDLWNLSDLWISMTSMGYAIKDDKITYQKWWIGLLGFIHVGWIKTCDVTYDWRIPEGIHSFFTAISPIYLRFARVIELVWVIHSLPGLWKKIGGSSAHLYSHGTNPDVWIILKQSNPNKLTRYPQQPQSFISKNLSEACCQAKRWDLLLTWLCTKASRSLFRNLLRNPVKPKLALHQSLPHPEPRWTWPGGLWCRAKSGSTGFPRRFWRFQEALAQSQVRSNRVPEKEGRGD